MPSSPLFVNDLTPQRRHLLREFVENVRERSLSSTHLQFVLIHFRETEKDSDFREWGSSVAHVRRNQGTLWEAAIAVWTTHIYYSNLDSENLRIDPLPLDIYNTLRNYLDVSPERDLFENFGAPRAELIATIDYLYTVPKKSKGEKDVFAHLTFKEGIEPEDLLMIRKIIIAVEDYALNIPPLSLLSVITAIEKALQKQNILEGSFSKDEREYLQLHALVSFHNTLVEMQFEKIKDLTGAEVKDVQPMAFVNTMGDFLSLDLGFFEFEGKRIEPAAILDKKPIFGNRLERFACPFLQSDLPTTQFMVEHDENVRFSLQNHPLRVVEYREGHVMVAEERESTPYGLQENQQRY